MPSHLLVSRRGPTIIVVVVVLALNCPFYSTTPSTASVQILVLPPINREITYVVTNYEAERDRTGIGIANETRQAKERATVLVTREHNKNKPNIGLIVSPLSFVVYRAYG